MKNPGFKRSRKRLGAIPSMVSPSARPRTLKAHTQASGRGAHVRQAARKNREADARETARGRIITGARRHFFASGFRGVTMDDLAGELGMSKKTLYQHFANKNSLLEAVMQGKFHEVDADLGDAIAGCAQDFLGALRQLLVCLQKHTEELQAAFVRDVRRSAPELFRKVEAWRGKIIQRHFTRLLSAGQEVGLIRKDIPLQVAIGILLGMTQAIVNPAKVAELNLTPRSAFSAVITVFLEGMITTKGRTSER